jgi:hypothetical protein
LIASACASGLRSSAQAAGRHRLRVDQRRLRSSSESDAALSKLYDALQETELTF